ncbi:MAG: YwiC-like family protein [Gemmatimonadota bacterium]|nr:MAG: YwiC-like family protein [Gemmatimonadota bacterium]
MTQERASRGLSLLPREHGAYAQLGFPLLTALALGDLSFAPVLLVVGIVAVFLVHEPVMVLSGGRGGRARREQGDRARRRGVMLLAVAAIAGAAGLWLAPPTARFSTVIPLALGASLAPLTIKRQEKTLIGESLVSVALSSTMIPVALAGGSGVRETVVAFVVWAVVFLLGTITVRAIIARAKKTAVPSRAVHLPPLLSAAAIAIAIAIAIGGDVPALAAVAIVPTAFAALIFGLLGVHPRNLRRLGWSLVASNVLVLAALLVGLA